jgi:hypothetical protein
MVQALENSGMRNTPLKVITAKKETDIQISKPADVPARADSVSITMESSVSVVYSRNMVLEGNPDSQNQALRDYVVNLLQEQGIAVKFAIDSEKEIDFTAMTPDEARELISEDGYFGVEKTSDRIVEFATGAAGADVSKLDQIKDAVLKGFKEAEEAFGGTLADISYETLDAVMEKLDKWAEQAANSQVREG